MGVQVRRRLVQVHDRGFVQESAGQEELLLHAQRITPHRQVRRFLQLDLPKALVHALSRSAIKVGEDLQVPPPGELVEVVVPIGDVAEKRFHALPLAGDVESTNSHLPTIPSTLAHEHADPGALPSAPPAPPSQKLAPKQIPIDPPPRP